MSLIQLNGINKTYDNGQPLHVLKGIDLNIGEGEYVSIMGASGSYSHPHTSQMYLVITIRI